ncbi:YeeE/YedE thiosulfate transporter family protein [Paraburkholderia sp. 40]|uniref:YeeE/YedE thiosulfate transporter family protein n=1 Tax=Paraburkholderia sp. 40 TaxID=2991059 RepID=UPI003D1AC204
MNVMVTSIAFVVAALCAGVMGFAIQRGATCTVVAVNEIVGKRRFNRLIAIVEASVWVAGGLVLAQMLQALVKMPAGYPVNYMTVLGGALLGFGAFVNGACVFGAIARLGSGEWAYVATPLGFYVGCLSFRAWWAYPAHQTLAYGSFVFHSPASALLLFGAFIIWRITHSSLSARPGGSGPCAIQRAQQGIIRRSWSPHAATTVIGITFVVMLLLVGAWSYTDVLTELARGMATSLVVRIMLLLALLLGAVVGGRMAGRSGSIPVSALQVARCLLGGALMGWGSLLIPGGNDGLLLVGMPLLYPYAWVAFVAMCTAIGTASVVEKAMTERSVQQAEHG